MNRSTMARALAKGIRLLVIVALLVGFAVALQTAAPAVRAGPAYQPPTNNVYVIHAGAYVNINTPIGASPGPADDVNSGAANCTLRDAIGIVNAGATVGPVNGCTITTVGAPAGNIYRINLPIGGYTYTLNGAELLTTANTVYIVGDTAANTVIQANAVPNTATYRVLRNNGATVELGNVTIRHGRCAGACAGIGGSGGGLYNQSGTMTVDNSIVSDNTADWGGGGICNEATLNVQNGSTIGGAGAGNQANDNGGGIYNLNGTTTVSGSTVSTNWASLRGGGIYNRATLNIQNGSTIGGAGAGNQADDGGGIYNWWVGTTAVDGSTVSANAANLGGGIYNLATLNVQNGSTIGGAGAGNQATLLGGGIYNPNGTTTMDGSTVSANRATVQGGGIYNLATLNVQNGSTIGGAGTGNQATAGGGICNWAGITTVDASTVSANTATFGGGITNRATLNVQNGSTIGGAGVGNIADTGGGINNISGTTTVDASTVSANTAGRGGGIYNEATLIVQNGSTIGGAGAGNQATGPEGGGIFNFVGTVTVDASTVSANTCSDRGGGIYNASTLTVQNGSTIGGAGVGNQANSGGGIFTVFAGTTTVTGSRILYNTATTDGGGVFNDITAGATSMTGSCIVGNSSTSFLNNQAALQIATGNWWGAATGPNTSGADTTGGNVDTSGFLIAPILGCPASYPDLQVLKANDTGGSGTVGMAFNWTLTVANPGVASALFTAGQRILEDDLPAGPSYGAPAPGNFTSITNPGNITCTIAANTLILTCDAVGADVTIGATTGSFDVVLSVTPNAAELLSNPAGNCRVDPDDNVVETDEGNNDCPANSVNVLAPDLQVLKANDTGGSGTVGTAFNWTLTVANPGVASALFTAGQRMLEDDLPAGPTYGAPAPGNFTNITNTANITCTIAANTLTCDAVGADVTIGATTGSFDVVLSVTPNAAELLSNPAGNCRVDPDDNVVETDEGNNDCPADSVSVAAPDLQVLKANDTGGSGTVGTAFNWTLTVANPGGTDATFTAGQRILEDDLPAGPSYGAPVPGNFTNITNTVNIICTIAANTLTCDAVGADVTIGATTGSFDIVLSVTPNAAGILNNPPAGGNCRVDPDDNVVETDEGNNDCANNVNVATLAPTPSPPDGGDDDDDEPAPPPPPAPIPAPKAEEFNCWPWLVIVPPGAAPNAVPGEWCQASLGQPLPVVSTFRYLGHSTDVTVKDAAGMVITSFARPIKVCFHYTQPELGAVGGDPASFLIQVFRDGKWEALDTKPEGSLSHPGVCAPVDHLTLFALFARDGATSDASAAAALDSELLFPTHLPETGERPLGSGGWGLLVAGVAILAMGVSAWLLRRR